MESTTSERLKQLMKERRLRQVEIIELCQPYLNEYGIKFSKSEISQWVSGKSLPGQKKIAILSMGLNVSEAWLMGFDAPMERNVGQGPKEPSPTTKQQEVIDLILSLSDDQLDKVRQILSLVSNP